MPRLLTGADVMKFLTKVEKIDLAATPAGDTTLATPGFAVDASTVPVTASTGFASSDTVIIRGSQGVAINTIGTPATTMPVNRPMAMASTTYGAGTRFVKARVADLGQIAEGGVQWGGNLPVTEVRSSTSRVAIAYWPGSANLTWTIPVMEHNQPNLASIFGVQEPDAERGAGTAADPYALRIDGTSIGTQGLLCFRCTGLLDNSDIAVVELLDCTVEVNTQVTMGAANAGGMNIVGRCKAVESYIWTPA